MNSNPIFKINVEIDLGAKEVSHTFNGEYRLDIGSWKIAVCSVAFHNIKPQEEEAEKSYIFDIVSSLVTENRKINGKYVIKKVSLGRFCFIEDKILNIAAFNELNWFYINNYTSDRATFGLELWQASKDHSFEAEKVLACIEILLQRAE